ncbi:MAG: cytochrome c oxidase assembly protein [Xanthomonadaceae bacterium]|nr:cytochrome c oxidase assembly protein [Xanthomonadaceae bacterium]MDE1885459.1 cytochrome c oxidase assembly protein [Xanthomonadaceae bacterium]MDE1960624.1 cytochrome c oxidase assembly protein [Xanthomonadaceae bacterium]MDE2085299.1 cytochrome c oxidase assembly protein [Xanthomonadaceae bacterium]MDE2257205.1 cytochrome c oxidase assembly protein [Xanthomonadaceae bacterium]
MEVNTAAADSARRNRRFLVRALVVSGAMFLFGFACVPIYRIMCVHVFQNRIDNTADSATGFAVDTSRWVTVQFVGNVNSQLDWSFAPEQVEMRVHPGAVNDAWYDATNKAQSAIVGNAVPSIAPSQGSPYFNKIECFCFTEQVLKPGESRRMPVKFIVDPKLPKTIDTLTLSYTFYNNRAATRKLAEQPQAAISPNS